MTPIFVKRSVKERLPKQLPNNPEYSIGVNCLTEDSKPAIGYFDLVTGGFIDGHTNNYVSHYKIESWLEEMSLEEYLEEVDLSFIDIFKKHLESRIDKNKNSKFYDPK